jgi:hypothetical protein
MVGAPPEAIAPGMYPQLSARPIESPNRFWAIPFVGFIVKAIILIPIFIVFYLLALAAGLLVLINGFVVFFTGAYWPPAYTLSLALLRVQTNIGFYMCGLTDRYPGLGVDIPPDELYALDIAMPTSPSRGFAIPVLGGIARAVMMIPFAIWTDIVACAAFLAVLVAWIPVLAAGRYPVTLFELVRDGTRLYLSYSCYFAGLSDRYPSFAISMNNPGVKVLFLVFGFIAFILYLLATIASSSGSQGGG